MGRKSEQTEQLKKEVLTALEQTLGIVTPACKMAGIGRTTFYQWCKEDRDFNEKVRELNNHTLDFVESKLHKAIRDDNLTAVIFYLKSKGKGRGYVERQEIEMQEKKPLSWFTNDNSTTT